MEFVLCRERELCQLVEMLQPRSFASELRGVKGVGWQDLLEQLIEPPELIRSD
jgi:hypothetical protein